MASPSEQTTSVKLDPELRGRVQKLADARRRTPHWIMREAIAEYVTREEQREKFRADAEAAWEEYQATGLHLTAEDADAWLDRLEAGEQVAPPPWHR